MKKILLLAACLGLAVFSAGCGKNDNQQGTQGRNLRGMNASSTFKIDLPKGTATDLAVGKSVMVMGEKGTDGSISAKQIIIGDGDPRMFFGNHPPRQFSSSTTSTEPFGTSTPPSFDGSQMPEPPSGDNFQPGDDAPEFNGQPPSQTGGQMPPDGGRGFNGGERWQGRAESGGQRRMGGMSVARVLGKILKKDDMSITVEDQVGGSKFVLYSDKTEIYLAQPATSASSTPATTSAVSN